MGTHQILIAHASLSFSDFDQRAKSGESLTVAYLGGSLTWGAQATDPLKTSYRALVSQKLREHYPQAHFTFVDAAIGGTGSQLAAFRLQRDVLAYEPDLVFLDFTINDGAFTEPDDDRLSSYESLVRRMLQADIPVIQVILAVKKDTIAEKSRPLDIHHKAIGDAYGLPCADAVSYMREKVAVGDATPDELWDVPNDWTHPGDAGYALYAECVWVSYLDAVKGSRVCNLPEAMLHTDRYMRIDRFRLTNLPILPLGWRQGVPHRSAIAFDFICSRWMDDLVIAEGVEFAPLTLDFTGESVLLFGEGTQKSGAYQVRIDGGDPSEFQTNCKNGEMRYVQIVCMDLDAEVPHTIEITPLLQEGQELRLESICIAGGTVLDSGH